MFAFMQHDLGEYDSQGFLFVLFYFFFVGFIVVYLFYAAECDVWFETVEVKACFLNSFALP